MRVNGLWVWWVKVKGLWDSEWEWRVCGYAEWKWRVCGYDEWDWSVHGCGEWEWRVCGMNARMPVGWMQECQVANLYEIIENVDLKKSVYFLHFICEWEVQPSRHSLFVVLVLLLMGVSLQRACNTWHPRIKGDLFCPGLAFTSVPPTLTNTRRSASLCGHGNE